MSNGTAQFQLETNVKAPKAVTILLVRADLLNMATIFRIVWDIFFGIAMATLGAILGATGAVPRDRWILFWVCISAAVVFLILDIVFALRARREASG